MNDDLNRRLVALVLQEGRISHAELAERLGVSRPTVIDRVKRLEVEGVTEGYSARVSPASVNKPNVAFVAVRHRAGDDDALEAEFLEALKKEPDVLEAYSVAGEDCLLLKIEADTPTGVHDRLKRIRSLGDQVTTRTTFVLRTHFVKPGPSPFPFENTPAGKRRQVL
jgi:Lrp/AsnC family leucine-responsive transcriptional regulator